MVYSNTTLSLHIIAYIKEMTALIAFLTRCMLLGHDKIKLIEKQSCFDKNHYLNET